LSPPPPSSFASVNTGYPRFTWKMAVKTEREREREREREFYEYYGTDRN